MPTITRELFEELADHDAGPAVSVYLPTHVRGPEVEQDRIRLKNGLSEADRLLSELGVRRAERDSVLAPARRLLGDREFWRNQGNGLGVFLADGLCREVRLPVETPERATVGERFHLRPLLPALDPARFTVLALSRQGARLFEATRFGFARVEAHLPRSIDDVNWFVDREARLQHHPARRGAQDFHGHDPRSAEDEDLMRYLRSVALVASETSSARPTVVIAVEEVQDALAAASDTMMEVLVDHSVSANPDDMSAVEIHHRALGAMRPVLERQAREALERAQAAMGTSHALLDVETSLEAALGGRVEELFVGPETPPIWGRIEPDTMAVEVHDRRQPGDVDLVDRLVVLTLRHGGEVRVTDELPTDTLCVLRF